MPIVIWYSRLQPGVSPEAYERWVREVDYQAAKEIESIISYRVHRVLGPFAGEPTAAALASYDYVEIAEVTNMDDYLRDLESHPAAQRIVMEIGGYVESMGGVWGTPTLRE